MKKVKSMIQNVYTKISKVFKEKEVKKYFVLNHKNKGFIGKIFIYALLISASYVFLFPLIKMVSMSFMRFEDLLDPEVYFLSKDVSLNNFLVADRVLGLFPPSWQAPGLNFWQRFLGTFSNPGNLFKTIRNISFLAVVQTTIAAFTGFAFARYHFKFKKFWLAMVLITFVIPLPMVSMPRMNILSFLQDRIWIPIYDGLLANTFLSGVFSRTVFNTLVPQIIFSVLGQGINSAILVLIFYNFFKMIPKSLDEAARIDGATSRQVFYHVYIKLVIPIVIIVFLFSFIWNWNDGYTAGVFFSSNNPLVISRLSLFDSEFASLQTHQSRINEGFKTAATFLSVLPLLIIYIFAQKRFIEGIERTGLTGE